MPLPLHFVDRQGDEAAYLRATITVISSKCVISPNGYFSVVDAEEQEDGTTKPAFIGKVGKPM